MSRLPTKAAPRPLRLKANSTPLRVGTPPHIQPPLHRKLVNPPAHLIALKERAPLGRLRAKDGDEALDALVALPAPDGRRDALREAAEELRVDFGEVRLEEQRRARGGWGRRPEVEVRGEEVHPCAEQGQRVNVGR